MADDKPNSGGEQASAGDGDRDSLRQGAEKARDAFRDHVVEPAKRAGEALKESGQKIAENSTAFGAKLIDQAEHNASQAFAAMRAAASARDVAEVMKIQGDFLREQGERSMAHAREVGELIMKFGRDAVSSVRGSGGEPPRS